MYIDDDCIGQPAKGVRFQNRFKRRERVVIGAFHKDLPQDLHHQHLASVGGSEQAAPLARCGFGKVYRPDDARLSLDERQHVLLIKGMIAKRDAMILLAPAIIIFVVASSKFGLSHHCRYILPCIPFVFIWISGLALNVYVFAARTWAIWNRPNHAASISRRGGTRAAFGLITLCLLGWTIGSSLAVYPHSISYFNELAGGPKNGPSHLINSNVDWGQDLLFLDKWIEQRQPADDLPVYLAFYNYYNPFDLKLNDITPWPFLDDESNPEVIVPDGVYAISVNLLYEFPWPVRALDGGRYTIDQRPLAYLRAQEPIGRAGYSIRIFSAEQMRSAYAAPPAKRLWNRFK